MYHLNIKRLFKMEQTSRRRFLKMKRIILSLCLTAVLLSALVLSVLSADVPDKGVRFEGKQAYILQKELEGMPRTIEAWINCDSLDGVSGIFGNFYRSETNAFSLRLSDGIPTVFLAAPAAEVGREEDCNIKFGASSIAETGVWIHLAVTFDLEGGSASCYKNGERTETLALTGGQISALKSIEFNDETNTHKIAVGGGYSWQNPAKFPFKGQLYSIAVYSDIRTAEEIQGDMGAYRAPDKSGLMAAYVFDSGDMLEYRDLSGNKNHLSLKGYSYAYKSERSEPSEYDYSMVVVGDTQCLTKQDDPSPYYALYDWIGDNLKSKKVEAVIGVGDMTNNNVPEQWERVVRAFGTLEGKVRHFPVLGNHDISVQYGGDDQDLYNKYLPFEKNENRVSRDGTMRAYYEKFEIGEEKYLFLGLGYAPSREELIWAKSVANVYKDRSIILSTHAYLDGDGKPLQKDRAVEVREQLVMECPNIVLVLCGHMHDDNARVYTETREDGTVYQAFFTNPQDFNNEMPYGVATVLYFSNGGKKVDVVNHIVGLDAYFGSESVRSFELDLVGSRDVSSDTDTLENAVAFSGFQIRTEGYNGIRCMFALDEAAISRNRRRGYSFDGFGVVAVSAESLAELCGGDLKTAQTLAFAGKHPERLLNVFSEDGRICVSKGTEKTLFGMALKNIPEVNYRSGIYFIGYARWSRDGATKRTFAFAGGESEPRGLSLRELTAYAVESGIVSPSGADKICVENVVMCCPDIKKQIFRSLWTFKRM